MECSGLQYAQQQPTTRPFSSSHKTKKTTKTKQLKLTNQSIMALFNNIFRSSNKSTTGSSSSSNSSVVSSSSCSSNGSAISPNTPRDNTTWNTTQTIRYGAKGFTHPNSDRYHQYQGYFSKQSQVADDKYYQRDVRITTKA